MVLAVDDDGCDLLIEEDEDGGEERRDQGHRDQPPLGVEFHRVHHPATVRTSRLHPTQYAQGGREEGEVGGGRRVKTTQRECQYA